MKKILLIPVLLLAIVVFPNVTRAEEKITDLSKASIEKIVDKVLEMNTAGSTKTQIVDAVFGMVETQTPSALTPAKTNKGKSEIKKINFGQFKKLLRQGDSGQEVADLQEALNKIASDLGLNFDVLIADGKYGPNTVKVVKMIQAHQQLQNVDGIVGPNTILKLQKLLGEAPAVNTAPVITLVGNASMTLALNATYTEQGATATDAEDGNISSNIITTGTVNTAIAGEYMIKYDVKDSANLSATQVIRTVTVQ